jgi:hypothetical protein
MSGGPFPPYVVGQWVRGERFYGREELITDILGEERDSVWVVGTRRIGKTSLLRQLEWLTSPGDRGFFPLYWDLQGADDPAELALSFEDALLDAGDRLARFAIDAEALEGGDLLALLGALCGRLRAENLALLLLCDEVEELVGLQDRHPVLLGALRQSLRSERGIRTVLASSVRLSALAEERADALPFLHDFAPPVTIAALDRAEARSLIRQEHLPEGARPRLDEVTVEEIGERCGNHPYLVQLLCKRCLELGDLEAACAQVASDRMLDHLFSVDLALLPATEQRLLPLIARLAPVSPAQLSEVRSVDPSTLTAAVERLEKLGLVIRDGQDRIAIGNVFLDRWLGGRAP